MSSLCLYMDKWAHMRTHCYTSSICAHFFISSCLVTNTHTHTPQFFFFIQVVTPPFQWVVIVCSLPSLFTASPTRAPRVSACRITIPVSFLWRQHETPRGQILQQIMTRAAWLTLRVALKGEIGVFNHRMWHCMKAAMFCDRRLSLCISPG